MQVIHYIVKYPLTNEHVHVNLEINYDDQITELEYMKLKQKLIKSHKCEDIVICNIIQFPKIRILENDIS